MPIFNKDRSIEAVFPIRLELLIIRKKILVQLCEIHFRSQNRNKYFENALPWLKSACNTNAHEQAATAPKIEIELLQSHLTLQPATKHL